MTDCALQKIDNGKWWCPACDPDRKRLLPVNARRNCGKVVTADDIEAEKEFRRTKLRASSINSIRSYLDLHRDCTATEYDATAHLDQCIACDEFSGTCCRRIEGTCATKYPRWVTVICEGTCERFAKE